MEEPTLPVIYADIQGYYANAMHGYIQDMGNKAASDCITPLPENRKLELKICLYDNSISEISYEIRSLDLTHYIENTTIDIPEQDDEGNAYAELPIQNMIDKDTPYLLKIKLVLGEKTVNYYTRIIWTDNDNIFRMIRTAADFTGKTFEYDTARDLTVYLETDDNADNSSLDTVRLNSSFSQITWGDSGMKLDGTLNVNVKEYDGMMGAIEVSYLTQSPSDAGDGTDHYENTDEFTMRAGTDRVYMLNYKRQTSQIFEGNKHLFAGNRIRLGIISKDKLQTVKSENSRFIVFKTDKELWSYDQTGKKAVNVFSFRSENDRIRASYDCFDIKALSVDDDGNVDFVVYGYMNRGRHEGSNGIVYYRYNSQNDSMEELFFIPVADNYENIRLELEELCTKSSSGMFYVKQGDAISAIDTTSQEMMSVVSNLSSGRYAVSGDQRKIAWLEGDGDTENSIKLMDTESGSTSTINSGNGRVLSVIGFYNEDLIYGERGLDDNRIVNGKIKGMPIYALHIIDSDLNSVMDYSKDGMYFDDIKIEGDRIHLAQYKKGDADHEFVFVSRDTIVSSEQEKDQYTEFVSSSDSETKKKVYFVELDENIKSTRNLEVTAPRNITYEKSGNIELQSSRRSDDIVFYSYANGELTGKSDSLEEALDHCYDEMGWITDANSVVLYNRADRTQSYTVREPLSAAEPLMTAVENGMTDDMISSDGYIIMDAQGIELNRLLYYINKGNPVMARLGDGAFCLIYAYDRTSVSIFYPAENDELSTKTSMDIAEAAQYFGKYQSDYICFVKYPGR